MKLTWSLEAFEDCLDKGPSITKVKRRDFKVEGLYPVVSQEAGLVNGYWNKSDDVVRVTKPFVIFGDHTKVVKFVDFDFVVGADGVKLFLTKDHIEPRWLFYWLQGVELRELGYSRYFRLLKELHVPVPPLPEQQRIVVLLDGAFERIDKARGNIENSLDSIYELMEAFVENVLLENTSEWEIRSVGDVCKVQTGKKDVNEGNPSGEYPFFTCAAEHTYSDSFSFDTEALLVAGNGNVGQVSYYTGKFEAYQRTYVLSDFRGISAEYLFWLLDKRLNRSISRRKLGNTVPYIRKGMLTEFLVAVPPSVQHDLDIREILARPFELLALLESIMQKKKKALEELKKSLLHQAFNGAL